MSREIVELAELQDVAARRHFHLLVFKEIEMQTDCSYLVDGLIPREGLAVLWGEPKSGKSFLAFDIAMHVAMGVEYRGRRVVQGAVVYVACEGSRGLGARVAAFRQHHTPPPDVPFYLVSTQLDLVADHPTLIADIAARLGDDKPVLIEIDTVNRSLHGSESSDADMGAYIKAADSIRAAFDCCVMLIHHCGIEASRPRGHTSLTGAADAQLSIKKAADGTITAMVEYMKDGREGDEIHSKLEVIEVAIDDDGQPITSCVVVDADKPTAGDRQLTPNQATAFEILQTAGRDGLSLDEWNERLRGVGIGTNRKATLHDIRAALKRRQLVYEYDGRWHVQM